MFSDPAVGNNFFGREPVLGLLRKCISSFCQGYRQNLAVISHQYLGKTSLIQHYLQSFHPSREVVPIYVEVKPQAFDAFADQFARKLLYGFLIQRTQPGSQESLAILMERAKHHLPKTISAIERVFNLTQSREIESAFSELLDLTSIFNKESGMKSLVILDEFHLLEDFSIKRAFQIFSKKLIVQKDTMYIIVSSSLVHSQDILSRKLSLLFGNFEKIYLDPFSFETADAFIQHKLGPVFMPEPFRHFLISTTDGHPFYLDVICRKLRELAERDVKTAIDRILMVEAFKVLLFDAEGILNQHFLNQISRWLDVRSRGNHLGILLEIASGTCRLKDIAHHIRRSSRDTSRQLNDLVQAEIVMKNGVFYYFPNKVLRLWLKDVYRHREMSLLMDVGSKARLFLQECEEGLDQFITQSQRHVRDRIVGLLKCFSNDMVELDDKNKKLPSFDEVIVSSGESLGDLTAIIGRTKTSEWFCDVQLQRVTEESVKRFLEESKSNKNRNVKRVLISLKGIDQNAKLLAKNTKIWMLNLQKINTLMEFYGQSKIISLSHQPKQEDYSLHQ